MQNLAGPWAARLIQEHLDALADDMVLWARLSDPQEFPPERTTDRGRFRQFYRVIADALASGDRQVALATFEQMAQERLRTKVRADSIIKLVDYGGDALVQLIGAQPVTAATASDALRQVRVLLANARMILSKVNIYLLTHPD